ncbi:phage tail tip lysozyme [Methylobacterium brachiatum]|uniref:phage tail tip lysozyme n=1 Tax=Methylobacterium brachiatum TaxID=269660 RepID=UPI0008EF3E23|nr:phage tail tip lysozyme [Methylobacterium brachiatum]SFI05580.1 Putative peptidoglycan binding domain-containing protein [Methylobacterium brachiatum]
MQSRLPYICSTFGVRAQNDLGYTPSKVAGLFGNGDVESGGYRTLQETHPIVEGSAGGFGWMQWTGPRRRAYEAWCAALGLDKYADETNYRYMVHELLTIETAAHRAILECADTPEAAAAVVCTKYLRPGVPHLERRIEAAKAAAGYLAAAGQASNTGSTTTPASDPSHDDASRGEAPAVHIVRGGWPEDSLSKFEVEAIQRRLLELGYHVVGFVDGTWGERTAAAITALQESAHTQLQRREVVIDGHYGPQTRALLADDASKASVSPTRARVTAQQLAAGGHPVVKAGSKITWASLGSIAAGLGAFAVALTQNWSTTLDLPFPFSLLLGFLPPWALPIAVVAFNVYTALKASGLIGAAVDRVRQGIDNTGAAQVGPAKLTLPNLPFGLDQLLPRS